MKDIFERLVGKKPDKGYLKNVFGMAMPLLMYGALYITWFSIIEKHRFSHYAVIHTALDDRIPFIEAFIVPYYLWLRITYAGFLPTDVGSGGLLQELLFPDYGNDIVPCNIDSFSECTALKAGCYAKG